MCKDAGPKEVAFLLFSSKAPKVTVAMSCIQWEGQTAEQILRMHRALGAMVRSASQRSGCLSAIYLNSEAAFYKK